MRKHRADVVVIFIAFTMCVATFVLGVSYAKSTAKDDFCNMVNATLAVPAPKPSDPAAHESRQGEYLLNQRFQILSRSYDCGSVGGR